MQDAVLELRESERGFCKLVGAVSKHVCRYVDINEAVKDPWVYIDQSG